MFESEILRSESFDLYIYTFIFHSRYIYLRYSDLERKKRKRSISVDIEEPVPKDKVILRTMHKYLPCAMDCSRD